MHLIPTLFSRALTFFLLFSAGIVNVFAQNRNDTHPEKFYQTVQTYINPVLPGDHPDPTLLKVGSDFYHCGSSFHFSPYLPIYHSTDLVHWRVISRVLPASNAEWVTDRPSVGVWQGAITYFYGSYWVYFSSGGQWFSKSPSPEGPWSKPVKVRTNAQTGQLGYDNSIFVDDGKPYMVIKNGPKINRLQSLGKDGQLTDTVINLDWINGEKQYSWAEGPVMCKRNGYYYYFPAGNVSGGQFVLRASALVSDSTKWERLGEFFKPITDAKVAFRSPNHMSAPIQLADGSWWTLAQSYEINGNDDWSGTGRQTSLYPVIWEGNRPWGMAPTTQPLKNPPLPRSGIPWRSVTSDHFDGENLGYHWHFLTKKAASRYSLNKRRGWITLLPDTGRTHVVQKETDHYYSAVTKLDLNATGENVKAGLYLTNGNESVSALLYSGNRKGKKIIFKLDTAIRMVPNSVGNVVWLKLERFGHQLTGYFSGDGKKWHSLGAPINAVPLDKAQSNYNSWVGTSIGLFAEGAAADFDFFKGKDGCSELPALGYSNYYGVTKLADQSVMCDTPLGGWFMISGVDMGEGAPSDIRVMAAAVENGKLEVWADDLEDGKLIASIPVTATGNGGFRSFTASLKGVKGQHDLFIRILPGGAQKIRVKNIQILMLK